jgi:two-component system, LytTR family, sensor histidine kinase AlgZ
LDLQPPAALGNSSGEPAWNGDFARMSCRKPTSPRSRVPELDVTERRFIAVRASEETAHHKLQHKTFSRADNAFMKRTTAEYWACQIGGWGAYTGFFFAIGVMSNGWRPGIVIGPVLFFVYSIGLTHLLRRELRRRAWAGLPLLQALARLAAASIAIATIQSGLYVAVDTAFEGNRGIVSEPSGIMYMFLGFSVVTTIWSVLYLAITFLRHSREVKRNEAQMKLALSEAELRALEAQLNPHFLFNCLNSIRGMISEDPAQAQDMVTRLANILRYNLRRDRQHTVPLASEVEAVSDYIALESIRFENRLQVRLEVDDAVRQFPIPPMLLQTLVENAIKHGVEEVPSGAELSIRAFLEDGALHVSVENTGELTERQSQSTQVGLANARERLRILYGERANLHLAACGKDRVSATVLIPNLS